MTDLPYVDEHARTVAAPPALVWSALQRYVDTALTGGRHPLLSLVLGTEPTAGFAAAETVPGERLTLAGRHRFSRYRLVLAIEPAGDATRLRALTYAAFPGPHGRVYRLLVISSRAHVVATRRMLRDVARLATGARSG